MTLKDAAANSLLMFVAATCVVLIVKAVSPAPQTPHAAAGGSAGGGSTVAMQDGIGVYYIHGNFRCVTCEAIENYARQAVETGFPDQLSAGRIEWHAVNFDEPGNERYVEEYEVVAPTVILARFEGGRQVEWTRLHGVWDHVNVKSAFIRYVQDSLREFMGASPAEVPTPAQAPTPAEAPTPAVPAFGAPASGTPAAADSPAELRPSEPSAPAAPVPEPQTPDRASSEPPMPASPLRSPTQEPRFSFPNPE